MSLWDAAARLALCLLGVTVLAVGLTLAVEQLGTYFVALGHRVRADELHRGLAAEQEIAEIASASREAVIQQWLRVRE